MPNPRPEAEPPTRATHELAILNAIAQALNASTDPRESLQTVLSHVAELLDLRTGWAFLLDEESGEPYLAAEQNLPPGLAADRTRFEGSCYCLDTYRQGDLNGAANVNVVTCSRLRKLVEGTGGLRYHASVPLYARGKKLGVLNVASPEWRRLSREDLSLLYTVGDMLGIAIERARLYARSIEAGATEERNRIAREIHDTLAQGLAAITLQLETADALLESGVEADRVRGNIGQALALARGNLEEARRSVLDLRAAPLEGRTLAEALAALAEDAQRDGGLSVRFRVEGTGRRLPIRTEVALYRIAQEALTNARLHARASHVVLRLVLLPDRVRLVIEDDGRGFDPAAVPGDRYGLVGLRERARILGGTLLVDSAPGQGARVAAEIPIE